MADSIFRKKLNLFLQIEVVRQNDFVAYICMLNDLTELLARENGFSLYSAVVKNWISSFRTIFGENKSVQSFCQTYMSKFCSNITKIFFTLLQCFRRFEPNYTQEFYTHWKSFLSRMDGLKRADSFLVHIDKFKIVVQHLRTAQHRCEQYSILSVLRLYMEHVPTTELDKLNEHDNGQIVDLLIEFVDNPTILNQHAFLQDVNALGHLIESTKPKKIICRKLKIDMDDSSYEMWLDFNKTDKSIIFSAVSLADYANQTFGIASRIKLRESVRDDHLLEIYGIWNVISVDTSEPIEKKVKFNFFLFNKTEQSISKLVKNTFRFVNSSVATGRSSQGFNTDPVDDKSPRINEAHLVQSTKVSDPERRASCERATQRSVQAVSPPKLLEASEQIISRPATPTSVNSIAIEQPENDCSKYNEISMDIEPNVQPTDKTFTIETNCLADLSDADVRLHLLLRNCNQSHLNDDIPNEVVQPQSGGGVKSRNKIEILEDITIVPPAARIESPAPMYHVPWKGNTKFPQFSQVDERISLNQKGTHNYYSQPTTYRENVYVKDSSNETSRNIRLLRQEAIEASPEKLQFGAHNRVVYRPLEDDVPASRIESPAPMQYAPWMGNVKFLPFSQVEERISLNRNEALSAYSQPTTSRETVYVKDSSSETSQNICNIQSNESVRIPSQKAITNHQLDGSVKSISRRSEAPLTPIRSQKPSGRRTTDVSSEGTQTVTPRSPQSQYDTFVPLATSTQRKVGQNSQSSQDRLEKNNFSQDMASSMKMYRTSSQIERLPQANRTCELSQTSDKRTIIGAGFKSSSQNALREQPTRTDPQKRTKCIAIADLPKMTQSHSRPVNASLREQTSARQSKETSQLASKRNSSQNQAVSSLEQQIERVPRADAKSTAVSLNVSKKRTKMPQSQTSERNAHESSPNASSLQQQTDHLEISSEATKRIKLSESPIQPADDSQSVQLLKATATASLGNVPEKQSMFMAPQNVDSVMIIDLPEDMDSSLNLSRKQTMPESPTVSHHEPIISTENRKMLAVQPTQTYAQKMAKKSAQNKGQPSKVTKRKELRPLNRSMVKQLLTATGRHLQKTASKSAPRYSSLKHNKPAVPISQRQRSQYFQIASEGTESGDGSNGIGLAECSKDGQTSNNEYETTDNIRVDDQGTVYDDKGCLFANNDELQRAAKFYIANDGLNYLKRDEVKVLPPSKREKYQRKLRAIQRMIDRGLDGPKEKRNIDINPYARTSEDDRIQFEKVKRRIKEVSVTLSEKRTIVDSKKNRIVARRTSKLYYIVDEGNSSSSASPQSIARKKKTMSKGKQFFNQTKTAQPVKTPHASSANLTTEKDGKTPSSQLDQKSMRENRTPKKLPIHASHKMNPSQQQHQQDATSTSAAEIRLPIYASQKMVETYGNKTKLNPPQLRASSDDLPSLNIPASVSTIGPTVTDDLSENIPRRCETQICSAVTCNNSLQDLMAYLNKAVMDNHVQGSGKFTERFGPNPTISDCVSLLNGLLNTVESMCDNVDQLQSLPVDTKALSK